MLKLSQSVMTRTHRTKSIGADTWSFSTQHYWVLFIISSISLYSYCESVNNIIFRNWTTEFYSQRCHLSALSVAVPGPRPVTVPGLWTIFSPLHLCHLVAEACITRAFLEAAWQRRQVRARWGRAALCERRCLVFTLLCVALCVALLATTPNHWAAWQWPNRN